MKAVEFETTPAPDGQIAIPSEIAAQLPPGKSVNVVLQWNASGAQDDAWRIQGRRRFESSYAPEDAIYEQLMNDVPTR